MEAVTKGFMWIITGIHSHRPKSLKPGFCLKQQCVGQGEDVLGGSGGMWVQNRHF